jgi:hypothetical protein
MRPFLERIMEKQYLPYEMRQHEKAEKADRAVFWVAIVCGAIGLFAGSI